MGEPKVYISHLGHANRQSFSKSRWRFCDDAHDDVTSGHASHVSKFVKQVEETHVLCCDHSDPHK